MAMTSSTLSFLDLRAADRVLEAGFGSGLTLQRAATLAPRGCDAERTVGMARVIGHGGLVFYIRDVIVLPEVQGRGIGTQMMDRVMAYLRAHAHHNSIIGLMAAQSREPFYEEYGFVRRPNERLGCGMIRFWREEEGGAS
jgi:GNAT superfamily N-acetyltransferase